MEYRHIICKGGKVIEVVDTRTVEGEKSRRIADAKAMTGEKILAAYPIYKQQNAALGIYDEAKCQEIKDGIQAFRADCDAGEAAINECETLEELDAI